MRSHEPELVTYRLYTNNKWETIQASATSEIHPGAPGVISCLVRKPSLRIDTDWRDRRNRNHANKPILLDAFCGGGGAAWGYKKAGFYVVGIDIKDQPRYAGDEFIQGDALEYLAAHGAEYDVIHASPPCQRYSASQTLQNNNHPDLIEPTRELLNAINKPWIIENVEGAPMTADLILCGSMFGLGYGDLVLMRHRWFESGGAGFRLLPFTPPCNHLGWSISVFGNSVLGAPKNGKKYNHPNERIEMGVKIGRIAMGIDWMIGRELSEAIPPAYTEYIGKQLLAVMERDR